MKDRREEEISASISLEDNISTCICARLLKRIVQMLNIIDAPKC